MQILGVYVRYETVMLALIVVFILSLIAQGKVKRVFKRYNTVPAARNVPAYQAAQEMLLDNGSAVTVHPVQGTLTDHYDPRNDTVGLSTEVYNSSSVAALAIAAHEIGHVLQYQENYAPIKWRTAVLPVANIGATFGPYMILIGLFMNMYPLAVIGLALYGAMFLFQLVTLPVEFNAAGDVARGVQRQPAGPGASRSGRVHRLRQPHGRQEGPERRRLDLRAGGPGLSPLLPPVLHAGEREQTKELKGFFSVLFSLHEKRKRTKKEKQPMAKRIIIPGESAIHRTAFSFFCKLLLSSCRALSFFPSCVFYR